MKLAFDPYDPGRSHHTIRAAYHEQQPGRIAAKSTVDIWTLRKEPGDG